MRTVGIANLARIFTGAGIVAGGASANLSLAAAPTGAVPNNKTYWLTEVRVVASDATVAADVVGAVSIKDGAGNVRAVVPVKVRGTADTAADDPTQAGRVSFDVPIPLAALAGVATITADATALAATAGVLVTATGFYADNPPVVAGALSERYVV